MSSLLSWPASLIPSEQEWWPQFTTRIFKSPFTNNGQTMEFPACSWIASVTLKNLTPDQVRELESFILQLRGASGRFTIGDFRNRHPRRQAIGNAVVNGDNQTGSTLSIRGCQPGETFLKVGDYITVANQLKRLTADAVADALGFATLRFEPMLRTPPADDEAIITRNTWAIMRLADDKQLKAKRTPKSPGYTLKMIEDIYY